METTTLPPKYGDPLADRPMDEISNYPAFFQSKILTNIGYWNEYVKKWQADVTALERERERILTALVFALNLEQGWPGAFELMTNFASLMERRGQWTAWQRILNQALDAAEQRDDRVSATTLHALLARLGQRQSQPQQTIYHYRRAIALARATGNLFEEARACSNLGYLFTEQGYWPRAEVLCCHALTLFEQINSEHGRAHTHNHLGILYTRRRRWTQAKQHLERACAIWQAMGDNHSLMRGLINQGLLYNEQEQPAEALACLEQALQQAEVGGEEIEVGTIYENMGIAHRLRGVPAQAEIYAWRAEDIFRRFSSSLGLAEVWDNLGLAYLDQGKWHEAWQYLDAALQSWRNLNYEYGEIRTLVYMVEYELARGNHSQAKKRLEELEHRHRQDNWGQRYPYLQELLAKHRRSLSGDTL